MEIDADQRRNKAGFTFDEWCQHRADFRARLLRKRHFKPDDDSNDGRIAKRRLQRRPIRQDLSRILRSIQVVTSSEGQCEMSLASDVEDLGDKERQTIDSCRMITLQLPPSQFWVVIEGIASYSQGSCVEQILLQGCVDRLPTRGRMLDLLPIEAERGKWTAQLCSDRRLGLLRDRPEDWIGSRLVLRHNDHNFSLGAKPHCPLAYSTTTLNPSVHRPSRTEDSCSESSYVASLSLVAFEGFTSSSESRENGSTLVSSVLEQCRSHPLWNNLERSCVRRELSMQFLFPLRKSRSKAASSGTILGLDMPVDLVYLVTLRMIQFKALSIIESF